MIPTLLWTLACGGGGEGSAVGPAPATPAPEIAPTAAAPSLLPAPTVDEGPRDTDCNLDHPGAWDPMLAEAQSEGSTPVVVRGKHGISETVRLNGGTEVRVVRGGCQHVGETWSIAPMPAPPHIAAMRALLNRIDLRDPTNQPSLLSCLNDEHEADAQGFDCGDAYVQKTTDGGVLEFTWSFAL